MPVHLGLSNSTRDARTTAGPYDGTHSSRQVSSSEPNKRSKPREKRREGQRQQNWTAGEGRKTNNIIDWYLDRKHYKITPSYQTDTEIDKTSPTNEHQLLKELLTYQFGSAALKPSSPHDLLCPSQAWSSPSGSDFLTNPGPGSEEISGSTAESGGSKFSGTYPASIHDDLPKGVFGSAAARIEDLERPQLDNRSYNVIALQNQLGPLPIHKVGRDKAGAALDVNVASFSNVDDMPGITQAVEHLLSMGTMKYAREDAYYDRKRELDEDGVWTSYRRRYYDAMELATRRAELLRHKIELARKRAKLSETRKQLTQCVADFDQHLSESMDSNSICDQLSLLRSHESVKSLRSLTKSQEREISELEKCSLWEWKYLAPEQETYNSFAYGHDTGWFDDQIKPVYTAMRSTLFQEDEPPDEQEQLLPKTRHSMKRKETPKKMERCYHDFRIKGQKRKESLGPLAPQESTKVAVSMVDELETVDEVLTRASWASWVDLAHGQTSLDVWRNTAGRSKSWRRCPKSVATKASHKKRAVLRVDCPEKGFAKSPLWVPSAFVRSAHGPKARLVERPAERRESSRGSSRVQGADRYGASDDIKFAPGQGRGRKASTDAESETVARNHVEADRNIAEPGIAFLRLTWKDKTLADGVGQLDRFLPTGLQFRSGWRIYGFLRNDSHADVYSMTHIKTSHSNAKPKGRLEAHVFLDAYHGNCAVYAKRQQSRMRESGQCLDGFWYVGRRVLVMDVAADAPWFRLRNTEEEFPSLVDTRTYMENAALQRRCLRGKPSFAAIVGKRRPEIGVVRQVRSMPREKTQLERELERIEKTRLKKAENQRAKRRQQRDKRVEEKLRNALEDMERAHKVRLRPLGAESQETGFAYTPESEHADLRIMAFDSMSDLLPGKPNAGSNSNPTSLDGDFDMTFHDPPSSPFVSHVDQTERRAAIILRAIREYERNIVFGNEASEDITAPETLHFLAVQRGQ
jgi:hypothetical protein